MRGNTVSELSRTLTVSDVVAGTSGRPAGGDTGRPIAGVSIDTRTLKSGQMFVASRGRTSTATTSWPRPWSAARPR